MPFGRTLPTTSFKVSWLAEASTVSSDCGELSRVDERSAELQSRSQLVCVAVVFRISGHLEKYDIC